MTDVPFVDVHVHFWDHDAPGLSWSWLRDGFRDRRWTEGKSVDAPRYLAPEFLVESDGCGVVGVVHGHCAHPIDDPAVESAWLDGVAERDGMPQALVGGCALHDRDAAALIRRHAEIARVRGVRDPSTMRDLVVEEVAPAMDVAGALGFSVEVRRHHTGFAELRELADRWPHVTITLSHACLPDERSAEQFMAWSRAMRALATRPNVVCKISALAGAADPDWTIDSIQPWILTCVEHFGSDRCALASNWPVDRPYGTYRRLVDAYRAVGSELDDHEQADLFHRTAARVYALDLPA